MNRGGHTPLDPLSLNFNTSASLWRSLGRLDLRLAACPYEQTWVPGGMPKPYPNASHAEHAGSAQERTDLQGSIRLHSMRLLQQFVPFEGHNVICSLKVAPVLTA